MNKKTAIFPYNPVIAKITTVWGNRIHPVSGKKQFHNGVDLATPVGTEVHCPADGKVILTDNKDDDAGGIQLKIQHDNNHITGYAHLSRILVSVGAKVCAGEPVAMTGRSGIGTGPHLHFTVREGKNPFGATSNPILYFDFKG